GLSLDGGQDSDTRLRCVGARLLSEVSEPPARLRERVVERGQLGRGCRTFRQEEVAGTALSAASLHGEWSPHHGPLVERPDTGGRWIIPGRRMLVAGAW